MRRIALALLASLALLAPAALRAQAVTGTVIDQQSGHPVPGALVRLVSSDGRTRAQALADGTGHFFMRAPTAGRYVLRAERIGYAATSSPPLELGAGQTVEYRVSAPGERTQLQALVASAGNDSRRCTVRPQAGEETAALWDEARKALEAAVTTRQQYPYRFKTERRIRALDPTTLTVRHEEVRAMEGFSDNPFVAVSPERLARSGYVETLGDTVFFHAPDAAVLLSDPFLESHCFRSRRPDGDHEGMVGLAFEPVREGENADVTGVLWLDAQTAELRTVDYRYTRGSNAPAVNDRAGGRVEFKRLPNGAWIVTRWRILMPASQAGAPATSGPIPTQQVAQRVALAEEAGQVVEIRDARGTPVEMVAFATLTGVVFDSTRNRPLAGARVSLAGTADSTRTDAEGRFTLAHLAEGVYALGFAHPRLDSLHFVPDPAIVTVVPPQEVRRDLAVPSVASILASTCRTPEGSAVGAAVGYITDKSADEALPGVPLSATWEVPGSPEPGRAGTVTDETGGYRFCSLPEGARVRIVAKLESDSAVTQVEPRRGVPQQRDLTLAAPAELLARRLNEQREWAHVVGKLVDANTGRPIEGAKVSFGGSAPEQTTGRNGEFTLDVPSGTYAIAFEHRTYGTGTARLAVSGRGNLQYELRIPRRTVTLEPLAVVAERIYPGYFNPRTRGRRLDIVTRDEIERRAGAARDVGDLVRTFPGIEVTEIHYPGTSTIKEICIVDRTAMPAGAVAVGGGGGGDGSLRSPGTAAGAISGRRGTPVPATSAPNLGQLQGTACHGAAVALDEVLIGGNAGEFLRNYPTADIESIIYLKPTDATGRYGLLGQNGVILIYTRGNGPTVRREQPL
jgi:hypothetical protein